MIIAKELKRRNSFMIHWLHQEEGFCEGSFKSDFFRDDENGFAVENNKVVYVGPDYLGYMKDGE